MSLRTARTVISARKPVKHKTTTIELVMENQWICTSFIARYVSHRDAHWTSLWSQWTLYVHKMVFSSPTTFLIIHNANQFSLSTAFSPTTPMGFTQAIQQCNPSFDFLSPHPGEQIGKKVSRIWAGPTPINNYKPAFLYSDGKDPLVCCVAHMPRFEGRPCGSLQFDFERKTLPR